MPPEINENVRAGALILIEHFEGRHLTSYVLKGETWATIGVGTAIPLEQHPLTITNEEANRRFYRALDLRIAAIPFEIGSAVFNSLTDSQKISYLSFRYNAKPSAWKPSNTRKLLAAGNLKGYRDMALRWVNGEAGRLPGLVRRRKCETFLWDGGTVEQLKAKNFFIARRQADIFGVITMIELAIKLVRFLLELWKAYKGITPPPL